MSHSQIHEKLTEMAKQIEAAEAIADTMRRLILALRLPNAKKKEIPPQKLYTEGQDGAEVFHSTLSKPGKPAWSRLVHSAAGISTKQTAEAQRTRNGPGAASEQRAVADSF